ncbi:SEFIR domain-containing protein [Nocardia sp.]|uniref:SEFIR domain-containing protein n=1 Tax=Nocardia sp. TaxID=1821 RepID=UPI002601E382|nr:SEFIR domain-containing protein [Nocardia sp.]
MTPRPADFTGLDTHLMKINYDFFLEPGTPGPAWFEVGFTLSVPETENAITVIDALPRHVPTAQEPRSYGLDRYLAFVPGDGVHLPASQPIVHLFGLGGPGVRWRHTAVNGDGIQPGSYTSWTTLTVPAGCAQVAAEVTARFDFAADSELAREYAPAPESATVSLRLESSTAYAGLLTPAAGPDPLPQTPREPRVFISYTHDDREHCEAVLRLSAFLATDCGFDVHMDRWDLDERRDWSLWASRQIEAADFVIVIASPQCKLVAGGHVGNLDNRGMQSEMSLLRELLHDDREVWLRKLLPVVLPGRAVTEIPLFLQPNVADHYLVTDYTPAGADDLLRVITGQPPYRRPPRRTHS